MAYTFQKLVSSKDVWIPSTGFDASAAPRVLTAQFGDGYMQRTPKGLNNVTLSWNLTWMNRAWAYVNDMLAFFEARKGSEGFYWTEPKTIVAGVVATGTQYKVYCPEWRLVHSSALAATVSARFVQTFEILV